MSTRVTISKCNIVAMHLNQPLIINNMLKWIQKMVYVYFLIGFGAVVLFLTIMLLILSIMNGCRICTDWTENRKWNGVWFYYNLHEVCLLVLSRWSHVAYIISVKKTYVIGFTSYILYFHLVWRLLITFWRV